MTVKYGVKRRLAILAAALLGVTTSSIAADKPNILVIWGDDIGQTNVSAYTFGLVGYKTPNIDSIAKEGMMFFDYYGEQSCTAIATFITGQTVLRTGLSKVDAGADLGLQAEDVTIAELLKPLGYMTSSWVKPPGIERAPPHQSWI